MCGRYQLDPAENVEIAQLVRQIQDRVKTGEIFPTNQVPVLMETGRELAPQAVTWGYPRFGGKPGVIINARSETALERPMFRRSLLERRCILPATGFYEWGPGEGGGRQKYRFHLPGTRALYLAGVWNDFAGQRRCVVLTTAANRSMQAVHDRMPVLLRHEQLEPWVRDTGFATGLLGDVPPELEKYEA